MTETPETLAQRLRKFAAGRTEWRVQHPETGTYCIAYSNNDGYSINPELSAREWLSNHQRDYPNSQFAGYVVKSVILQTQSQQAMTEAAAALEAQAAQIAERDAQIEALRDEYERACKLVADMHAAAMGAAVGPSLGVVEDIAALKAAHDQQAAQIEALRADAEQSRRLIKSIARAMRYTQSRPGYAVDWSEMLKTIEAAMAAKEPR